jgi:hypothetical protein
VFWVVCALTPEDVRATNRMMEDNKE